MCPRSQRWWGTHSGSIHIFRAAVKQSYTNGMVTFVSALEGKTYTNAMVTFVSALEGKAEHLLWYGTCQTQGLCRLCRPQAPHGMCKSATACQCIWPCRPRQRMLSRLLKDRNKPRVCCHDYARTATTTTQGPQQRLRKDRNKPRVHPREQRTNQFIIIINCYVVGPLYPVVELAGVFQCSSHKSTCLQLSWD